MIAIFTAYSFSAAISGIIGGRLSDVYEEHTKTIAMVSILLMIFGSMQYTVGYSVWNVFISRLVCGMTNYTFSMTIIPVDFLIILFVALPIAYIHIDIQVVELLQAVQCWLKFVVSLQLKYGTN